MTTLIVVVSFLLALAGGIVTGVHFFIEEKLPSKELDDWWPVGLLILGFAGIVAVEAAR